MRAARLAARRVAANPYFACEIELEVAAEAPLQEDVHPGGKVERLYRNGRCEVLYPTGTRKEVQPSGVQTVVFVNGDIKQTGVDRRVVYYYAEAQTTHVSEADGTQLYHFPNGQVERHFVDGLKEIRFVDGSLKVIMPGGEVQTIAAEELAAADDVGMAPAAAWAAAGSAAAAAAYLPVEAGA